jgi:hypothetical protein
MYATTGLYRPEYLMLVEMIREEVAAKNLLPTWPPSLGLTRSVRATLIYIRRNRVQVDIAETFDVSQPTISRAIAAITPLIDRVLQPFVATAEELFDTMSYLVDGTLVPCWSWRNRPDLYSGKHKTTGMNLQVAATVDGRLAWISDPLPGSVHDVAALDASGVLETLDPHLWVGDKGYIGRNMITPKRKHPGMPQSDHDKEFNKTVNHIRAVIERVIANIKTWRILHTDYRRPINTFPTTISATIGLIFWTSPE